MSLVSLFFVTTSVFDHWVICVPAAFLRSGSRFSGSLSGIEPWFPVTRYRHCRHLTYNRKLIRQSLGRYGAGSKSAYALGEIIRSHQKRHERSVLNLIIARLSGPESPNRRFVARISSGFSTVIRVGLITIQWIMTDLMSHSRFHLKTVCTQTCMA